MKHRSANPKKPSLFSVSKIHIFRLSAMTLIAILASTFLLLNLAGSAVFAAPQPSSTRTIPPGYSSRIIHVKFREGAGLDQPDLALPLDLRNSTVSVTPLFNLSKQELDEIRSRGEGFISGGINQPVQRLPDLSLWFQLTLKQGADATAFIEELKSLDVVETVEPAPLPAPPPAVTPDFTQNQGYLDVAPGGIDARFSWTFPGGNGSNVTIYDVEYSWNQTHEDLGVASGIPLLLNSGDFSIDPFGDKNHGTAVLGELIADNDTKGVTGISWDANIGLAPANTADLGYNPANAILLAVVDGSPGDVILIEQQITVCGLPVGSYGPSEWATPVFDAIQTATANSFVVVEAAGNGGVNLDQAACGGRFDRDVQDSGAIIVGAGGSAGSALDRQRLFFSSYGSRVDLQGWGDSVMTTGYGFFYTNPDDPANPDFWYTGDFNGTSSASPMVAGAAGNLQGISFQRFGAPLTAFQIGTLLAQTGSPQLGNTAQNIGPRPDLRAAILALIEPGLPTIVDIDVKPGSDPNSINCMNPRGVIPVAILTGDTFDALTVDHTTVTFEGASEIHKAPVTGDPKRHEADVDGDGDIDLLFHFRLADTSLTCDSTEATLVGQTYDGLSIEGMDSVNMVP